MPYISSESIATMRKAIRAALPEYTLSVRGHHHSTVQVRVMSGPIADVPNINEYHYHEQLVARPEAVAVIDTIMAEIKNVDSPRELVYDSDYGSVPTFYISIGFGEWDKPYIQGQPAPRAPRTVKEQKEPKPDDSEYRDKVQYFADVVQVQHGMRLVRNGFGSQVGWDSHQVKVTFASKYARVDIGSSGKYMIDLEGNIFGIKAYGVIHKGHRYGTLDTIDQWNWGDYTAVRARKAA